MRHSKHLGIINLSYSWDQFIKDLESETPAVVGPNEERETEKASRPNDLAATKELWNQAGYKSVSEGGSARWQMYFGGLNFDIEKFDGVFQQLGTTRHDVHACWVSRVAPGYCFPWHIDQHPSHCNEKPRYHIHLSRPNIGHMFIIEDEYYLDQPQGSAFVWKDPFAWHAGYNGGITNKWLLSII
jgi:hypothetical protein